MPTTTPQSPHTFTTSVTQLEAWELDLVAFFRGYKLGLGDGTGETRSAEVREPGAKESSEREKAQRFADRLDLVRHPVERSYSVL